MKNLLPTNRLFLSHHDLYECCLDLFDEQAGLVRSRIDSARRSFHLGKASSIVYLYGCIAGFDTTEHFHLMDLYQELQDGF